MKKVLLFMATWLPLALSAQKYVGGDISLLTKYETNGAKYYDLNDQPISNMLGYFKQQELNSMRVRLFVDPTKSGDRAACQDIDYVKALGKRIKDAGFSLMVDFHYSDTWADPGKQWTPDAWKSLTDELLYEKIYNYTKECLEQMVAEGATPDFIQTGNEISYGMLWGTEAIAKGNNTNRCYTTSPEANWTRFTTLLKQAGKACREVCPNAKIILHSERVGKPNVLTDFLNRMQNAAVDYDIIGLSYYPYHHGNLTKLETALTTIEGKNYGKNIMIVETGYYYAWQTTDFGGEGADLSSTYPISPTGQQAFTKAMIETLNKHDKVIGLYWWWMEACENGLNWNTQRVSDGWYNASLFNDDQKINGKDGITYNYPAGKAMPAISELKNFVGEGSGIETIQNSKVKVQSESWYTLDGRRLSTPPTKAGLYIHQGKKAIVR